MLEKFRLICYLHHRYNILPSLVSVSGRKSDGSFRTSYDCFEVSGRCYIDKVNIAWVYTNWLHSRSLIIFLHEVGHVAQVRRAATHKFTQAHITGVLFSEKRASVWAIRVAKLLGKAKQVDINFLDQCYGTYMGYYLKEEDPMKKADLSYRIAKTFGVRYDHQTKCPQTHRHFV
jgi:hypothetical protein